MPLQIDPSWNIVQSFSAKHHVPCYRFYPNKLKGEGFFITCLQKNNGGSDRSLSSKQKPEMLSKNEIEIIKEWIDPNAQLYLFRHKEDIIVVPEGFENIVPLLQDHFYLRQVGITIGKLATTARKRNSSPSIPSPSVPFLTSQLQQYR